MKPPTVHLICNAHLDPVWQWRWEEGCAEALSTFATAVELLEEHPQPGLQSQRSRALPLGPGICPGAVPRDPGARPSGPLVHQRRLVPAAGREPAGHRVAHPADRGGPGVLPRALRRGAARGLQLRLVRPQRRAAATAGAERLRDVSPHASAGARTSRCPRTCIAGAGWTARRSSRCALSSASTTPSGTTSCQRLEEGVALALQAQPRCARLLGHRRPRRRADAGGFAAHRRLRAAGNACRRSSTAPPNASTTP